MPFEYAEIPIEVPRHWISTTLGEVCRQGSGLIQTGPFGSQLHASDYVAVGIPSIMPVNIGDGRITESAIKRISVADAERLARHRVIPGDIVFSRRGDVERHGLVTEYEDGWLCGTGCVLVRVGRSVATPQFASYWLRHPGIRNWLVGHAVGSTMPNLNTSIMQSLPIAIPPMDEQRAIARILGALDDKIELNRQMNATLEGMARALFKSWFVDFDPVTAKAAGRPPFGLSADLAALFPDRFTDSPLGPIPEGWTLGSVADIARYVNGRNFTKGASGTGRMVIRIAELNSGPGSSTVYNDAVASTENVASPGDILFAWSGSLDVYRWFRDEALINQHIFKVICDHFPPWFVHQHLIEAMPFFQAIAAGKATTMGHIKREHLRQAELAIPPDDLLKAGERVFVSLDERWLANVRESLHLEAIRDALLPKLLSGEIRLRQAEKVVEEVA